MHQIRERDLLPPQPQPKVLLFDIGGVCVVSPFQAILDYERSHGIPTGWVNYSISKSSPDGYWHRLERGEIPLDAEFYWGFDRDLHHPGRWHAFCQREGNDPHYPASIRPMPSINSKWLFDEMMSVARHPDPHMYPALQRLKASGRYILGALSNTIDFPEGHPLHEDNPMRNPIRRLFDVFVSSSHVGMRKPAPEIYEYALTLVDKFARDNAGNPKARSLGWETGVQPHEIIFLDDIGENLREARRQGFGTIKVNLGRGREAVQELERVTGLELSRQQQGPSDFQRSSDYQTSPNFHRTSEYRQTSSNQGPPDFQRTSEFHRSSPDQGHPEFQTTEYRRTEYQGPPEQMPSEFRQPSDKPNPPDPKSKL